MLRVKNRQKEKEVERAEKWAKISHAKMINHESAFEFVWSEKVNDKKGVFIFDLLIVII